MKPKISGRTDHGTPLQAITFAVSYSLCEDAALFLNNWLSGHLDEWPEFYIWLAKQSA